jgi:DNA-directed RNA polymerase specialized sigma24 family protein
LSEPDDSTGEGAAWPERLRELARKLRAGTSRHDSEAIVGEIWVLLIVALKTYARRQAHRAGGLSQEDLADLASEKASDLLRKLDSHVWSPADLPAAQLCAFLATVARNGVVDLHRVRRREVPASEVFDVLSSKAWGSRDASEQPPISGVDSDAYAHAIVDCVAHLTPRARRAWYLRVFYEIASADIARDPVVATTPAGVDAMLARSRDHMRACLEGKGITIGPLPAGTFVKLWTLTRGGSR